MRPPTRAPAKKKPGAPTVAQVFAKNDHPFAAPPAEKPKAAPHTPVAPTDAPRKVKVKEHTRTIQPRVAKPVEHSTTPTPTTKRRLEAATPPTPVPAKKYLGRFGNPLIASGGKGASPLNVDSGVGGILGLINNPLKDLPGVSAAEGAVKEAAGATNNLLQKGAAKSVSGYEHAGGAISGKNTITSIEPKFQSPELFKTTGGKTISMAEVQELAKHVSFPMLEPGLRERLVKMALFNQWNRKKIDGANESELMDMASNKNDPSPIGLVRNAVGGAVRVGEERRSRFVTADIVEGELRIGDEAH